MTTYIVTVRRDQDVQAVKDSLAHLGEIEDYSALRKAFKLVSDEDEAEVMWTLSSNSKISGAMNGDDQVPPAAFEPEWLYEGRVFDQKQGALRLKANQDPKSGNFNPWWQQPNFFQWRKDSDRLGQDAIIAIVDSGIRYGHPEFSRDRSRITRIYNYSTNDEAGNHGTACASVAAGDINGIAPLAELLDVRVFPVTGTTATTNIVNGLNALLAWVQDPLNNPDGKTVIANMSFGSSGTNVANPYGTIIQEMLDEGIIPVVAAGNDAQNLDTSFDAWPAEATDYAIGAIRYDGREATFTNYGNRVNFYGFGHRVPAAGYPGAYGTDPVSGTSFAAPYFCGCLATWVGGRWTPTDADTVRILMTDYLAFCQEGVYGNSVRDPFGTPKPGKVIGRASYFPIVPGDVIVPNAAAIASFGTAEIGTLAWKARASAIFGGVPQGVGTPTAQVVALMEGPFFADDNSDGPWLDPLYVPTGWTIVNDRIRNFTGSAAVGEFVVSEQALVLQDYWEIEIKSASTDISVGVTTEANLTNYDEGTTGIGADGIEWFADGSLTVDGVAQTATTTFVQGDVLMLAFDNGTGELWIGKNGTWTDDPTVDPASATLGATATVRAAVSLGADGGEAQFLGAEKFYSYAMPGAFNDFTVAGETEWVMDVTYLAAGHTASEGDTRLTNSTGTNDYRAWVPTVQRVPASHIGKVYWEMHYLAGPNPTVGYVPIVTMADIAAGPSSGTNPIENGSTGRRGNGSLWASTTGSGSQQLTGLQTFGNGDVVRMCFDPSTGELWTGVNGTWDDDPDVDPPTYTVYTAGQTEWALALQTRDTGTSCKLVTLTPDLAYAPPVGAISVSEL